MGRKIVRSDVTSDVIIYLDFVHVARVSRLALTPAKLRLLRKTDTDPDTNIDSNIGRDICEK